MSKKNTNRPEGRAAPSTTGHKAERRLSVRAVRRDPPDLRKLARALIDLAQAQAELEAQAEHEATRIPRRPATNDEPPRSQEAA